MTLTALAIVGRRLSPQRIRTRLAVMYTVLFLLGGVVLLVLTYTLVAHVLLPPPTGPGKPIPQRVAQQLNRCKQRQASGQPGMPAVLIADCTRAFGLAGASIQNQRVSDLVALRAASLIGLGVLALASAGLGWLVSGRALRPVRSLTEAAKRASELQLGQRLALVGPDDELKALGNTFDVMLERLDAAFTSQKRFVANAAHELRTPLTAMRTAIEVTLAKPTRTPEQLEAMATRVKHAVDRAQATIEALLTLATSEVRTTAQDEIDLATAAEDALDAQRAAIERRRLTVDAALESSLTRGDRTLLERMVANLVENAVRHNRPGGRIGLRTTQREGGSVFEIDNDGPSVSAEQIPTLFEPFARARQRLDSSDGAGLGLSIASAIAHAHDTTITARPRPGGGLAMSVRFPASGR